MRTEEKSEYVELVLGQLGDIHPDLQKSIRAMKTQNLIYLSKTISDLLGTSVPEFPHRTQVQKERLAFLTGSDDEPDAISQSAIPSV